MSRQDTSFLQVEANYLDRGGNSPPASDYTGGTHEWVSFSYQPAHTTTLGFSVVALDSWDGYFSMLGDFDGGGSFSEGVQFTMNPAPISDFGTSEDYDPTGGYGNNRVWEASISVDWTDWSADPGMYLSSVATYPTHPFYLPQNTYYNPVGWNVYRIYDVVTPSAPPGTTGLPLKVKVLDGSWVTVGTS